MLVAHAFLWLFFIAACITFMMVIRGAHRSTLVTVISILLLVVSFMGVVVSLLTGFVKLIITLLGF